MSKNIIENILPDMVRERMLSLITSAIALFLALRYNDYITELINKFIPIGNGLLQKGLIILGLTFVSVFFVAWLEKALNGK